MAGISPGARRPAGRREEEEYRAYSTDEQRRPREDYAVLRAITTGATEAEIRSTLGEPAFVHPKGTGPEIYCLSGRACLTDRIVTSRLLVYIRGKPYTYYFLDASGRVEYVYVGGA